MGFSQKSSYQTKQNTIMLFSERLFNVRCFSEDENSFVGIECFGYLSKELEELIAIETDGAFNN
jgi:hypothetical protein